MLKFRYNMFVTQTTSGSRSGVIHSHYRSPLFIPFRPSFFIYSNHFTFHSFVTNTSNTVIMMRCNSIHWHYPVYEILTPFNYAAKLLINFKLVSERTQLTRSLPPYVMAENYWLQVEIIKHNP